MRVLRRHIARGESMIHNISAHSLTHEELLTVSLAELEFPKVMEHIASFALSNLGAERIINAMPTPDIAWLREEHIRTNEMMQMLSRGEQFPIEGLSDVRPLLQKSLIAGAFLVPAELLAVRDMIRSSRLCKYFFAGQEQYMPVTVQLSAPLHENRLLEKHIADTIDDTGMMRDTASRDLMRIRREIADTTNRLRQRLQKLLKRVTDDDTARDEFITQREGRFVLPMKVEYKRNIPGIIHGVSQTGQTVFVEPAETFDMNNELSLLHNEEQREIERIMQVLTAELAQSAYDFLRSLDILAHLDALYAKARYSVRYDAVKPDIVDEPEIDLRAVRHPLLAHSKGLQGVVPLSITFGQGIQGHLISGPNAGGKTVALKCIGISIAMALAGCFPLGYCRTNYRSIFSAIGDKQSIEDDVSTFSSQMIRLREILSHCSQSALALIDEIAAGTDPQEGAALAVGTLESLVKRGAMFVVTTHQSSLKSYALARTDVSNASMAFNTDKMEPTYKFLAGVPGNSYAFSLAESIGFPTTILERAKEYLGSAHSTLEQSIQAIQQFRTSAERTVREAEDMKRKAEQRKAEYEQKFTDFKEKYTALLRVAKQEAAEIVAEANKTVEQTIREIQEAKKPVQEIVKEFRQKKDAIQHTAEEAQKTPRIAGEQREQAPPPLKAGDAVTMEGFQTVGTIIAIDEDTASAVVEFDSIKMRTAVSKLQSSKPDKKAKRLGIDIRFDVSSRIDVRGHYPDEAIKTIEQTIGGALTSGVHTLTILHGKGTGALRTALRKHLENHPSVKEYRDGLLVEGGTGVTIVDLH